MHHVLLFQSIKNSRGPLAQLDNVPDELCMLSEIECPDLLTLYLQIYQLYQLQWRRLARPLPWGDCWWSCILGNELCIVVVDTCYNCLHNYVFFSLLCGDKFSRFNQFLHSLMWWRSNLLWNNLFYLPNL